VSSYNEALAKILLGAWLSFAVIATVIIAAFAVAFIYGIVVGLLSRNKNKPNAPRNP
jgi:uncharacterized membrane protein